MTPDSADTGPSHFGRTKKRRTNRPAIEMATANGPERDEGEIEASERARPAKATAAESGGDMVDGDQCKRAESPKYKCVREPGQRPLLDDFALRGDLPEEIADTRAERRELEIGGRPRAADDVQDRAQAPAEHRYGRADQQQ